MRKLKLFLDAKAANTPPRGISKASRVIFSVLTLLFLSIGQMWATDDVINNAATSSALGSTGTTTWKSPDPTIVGASGAEYTIHSMGTSNTTNAIQWNKNGFLYQTKSGGTLKSVTIKGAAKKINIFASNTAYSAKATGTQLAQVTASTSGVTYTFESDYTYLAINGTESSTSITEITVAYQSGGKTLSSVVVSGKPTKTEYYAGQDFDPAGLTVTGTYSDASQQTFTSGITWAYNPSQTLALNQTSIGVTATVSEITSEEFLVNCLTVTEAPAAASYEKVTAAPSDWSGEYLIVYENGATAYVWTGVDAISCYATATISNDVIAQPEGTSSVTIASMEGGYSILVNGGTNDGKYIQNNGTSNGIKFVDAGVATTLTYENNAVTITCGGKKFRYNNASGNDRFRYFGSAQQVIQLYKKVGGSVKPAAGLAFETSAYLVKANGTLATPTLSTADGFDGIVTYASSDEAVVKVNASTGAITEIVAAGKAVITAHSDETENFREGSASYTIYVAAQAGTAEDPLTEASAKALIDLGCGMDVYMVGTVATKNYYSTSKTYTVDLAGGMQYYYFYEAAGETVFETDYLKVGDIITAFGTLKKVNDKYRLNPSYMVDREEYTEPLVDISNTKETAYTVAQALALATNPTSDLTKAVYIAGVVYDVKSFNSTNGTLDIYIKDEGVENKFEFYKCAGIYDESLTAFTAADDVQVGDEVIGYGVMKYFSGGSIWEFDNTATGDYLVELTRSEVAVSSVELDQNEASIEVNETVTLHATVNPDNASNKAITWSVQSGNTYASVADGVVTGIVAGEAVIRAASTADPTKYAECTVTVTAADPTKHVVTFDATVDKGESPLSKSNITFTCSSGVLNNESEYRLYKSSTTTFACSVGNITKIEFTGVSGNPVSGFGDPEVGTLVTEGNNGVWTGNAASVSFVASGAQVRATEIVVTYKEDNRAAAGLTWSTDAVELTVGDEFTAPTLQNPNSIAAAEITIESDNENLAEVNAGVVSLVAEATGTATITATFNGNDDYKPATISYTITVNEAGLDNVTFDATLDVAETGELSISKSGFTLEFTNGALDNGENYRLYKSQTMTLSSTDYLIKKIEFTCTSGNPITGFADATGLDKDNNEWTGESNTVELTASNAQVRMTKIKVFYVEDTRAAAGLAWNPADDIELIVGGAFSAPALLNPNSIDAAEISIASSNTDVATVTAGVVALVADATGEATITATFAGNASYKPAIVSYKITVNPAYSIYVQPSLNVNFGSVNQNAEVADKSITVTLTGVDAATLTLEGTGASAFTISPAAALTASGDITISASSANIGTFAATLTISDDANNAESKVVNISITVNEVVTPETPVSTTSKWVPATEITDGMQVLIVGERNEKIYAVGAQTSNNRTAVEGSLSEGVFTPGENTMAFTVVAQEGGTYALQASNGKYLYAAGSGSGKNYLRSQDEVDDNAKWTLSVSSATANGTNTNNKLQLNNSSDIFSCYSSTQKAIQFYVPQTTPPTPSTPDYTRTVEVNRYGTICLPNRGTIANAKLFDLEYYDGANTLYLLEVTGNAMVAGRPYVFLPSATTIEVFYTDNANEDAGSYRGLVGSYSQTEIDANAGNYILYNNAYYLVNSTAYVGENRAYIHMAGVPTEPSTPQVGQAPRRRVAMTVNGTNTATGIDEINASEKPMKLMIDGQIYILRGEKMYDATGRLVK